MQAARARREPAHVVEHLFIQHADLTKRTNKSEYGQHTKIYEYSHSAGVMREGFAFSPSYLPDTYFVHACGVRVVILELGALGISELWPEIVDLSVGVIHSHFVLL